MFEKILVATDFTQVSRNAEQRARELAKLCGSSCVLLHVIEAIDDDATEEAEEFYGRLRERAEDKLLPARERFEQAGVPCLSEVRLGKRWQEVLALAEEEDADLIVLGSRQTVEEGKAHLGTVSQQVFFASPRSLLIVRSQPA